MKLSLLVKPDALRNAHRVPTDVPLLLGVVLLIVGGVSFLALVKGFVPAVRVVSDAIGIPGLSSLLAGISGKAFYAVGGTAVAAGTIEAALHNPNALMLWVPGAAGVAAGLALQRVAENLVSKWSFSFECQSTIKLKSDVEAIVRVSPHDSDISGAIHASVEVHGSAFTIVPATAPLTLDSQTRQRIFKVTPLELGSHQLEIVFIDENGDDLVRGHIEVRVYPFRVSGRALSAGAYRIWTRLSGGVFWARALLTIYDVGPKVLHLVRPG